MVNNEAKMHRYNRQIIMDEIGIKGQERLLKSHVLVVGAGGLGCPVLQYLVAAGVGKITLFDDDVIEESNLQRQVLYKISHLGRNKAEVAAQQLYGLNPEVTIHWHATRFSQTRHQKEVRQADVVLDCSDNFKTRFGLNRVCRETRTPLVAAAASGMSGQLWLLAFERFQPIEHASPEQSATAECLAQHLGANEEKPGCLACLFPEDSPLPTDNCNTIGVLGAVLGVLGAMQANLAMNLLLGQAQQSRFIQYQGINAQVKSFPILADPECECYTLA